MPITQLGLKLQSFNYQAQTDDEVVYYDTEGGEDGEGSLRLDYVPVDEDDAVNMVYVDNTLLGKPGDSPSITGTITVYDSDSGNWENRNVNEPIFNANLLQDKPLDLTGLNDGYVIKYDTVNVKFVVAPASDIAITSLTGAITGTGPGATATTLANNAVTTAKITNSAVTYGKIQNMTGLRLLGNPSASSAAPSEIPLGTGLSIVSGALVPSLRLLGSLNTAGTIGNSQSETNMAVISLAANTLAVNGQQCVFKAYGIYSTTASNLTIRFKFSSATMVTIPTATLLGNSASSWDATFTITRVTSSTIAWRVEFTGSDASSITVNPISWVKNGAGGTFDFTTANNVFMTAETGAAGSITWEPGTTLMQTV